MRNLQVLGICSAQGINLLPFKDGFTVLGNIEPRAIFHTPGEEQWNLNFKGIPFTRHKFPLPDYPDIIIGNPDCGHSSVLTFSRAKALKNPRENKSVGLFLSSVKTYKPKVFLMENLPALLVTFTQEELNLYFNEYKMHYIQCSVSKFGNSQSSRIRLVMVGVLKELAELLPDTAFTEESLPNPSKEELKTCEDLIGDLDGYTNPKFGHIREEPHKVVCLWYKSKKVNLEEAQEIWNGPLKDSRTWPGAYNTKTQPGVFKLFRFKLPLTVRKQNRQFDYNGLSLTPRQMARIQGVPDSYGIHIDMKRPEYWINKGRAAISKQPPLEISKWFHKQINKNYETIQGFRHR